MQNMIRRIDPFSLLVLSLNGIIGSGWLFAPFYAAKIAGSAALVSWLIGGMLAMMVAFTFAEISTMLPISGGTAHIPQISHGPFASFILGWIAWLSSVMLAPIEVQAVLQYASLHFPSLVEPHSGGALSYFGLLWATCLMVLLCILNTQSYKLLARFNLVIFAFKFFVILLTIFWIAQTQFNTQNFSDFSTGVQTFEGWKNILSAVASGGIILAFNGFKSAVDLAGETKRIHIALPLAIAGSVLTCLFLYGGLQMTFIGALAPSSLANGFSELTFNGEVGPFVGITAALGLFGLLKLLYANSVISPLGAGLTYVTSTARLLYAMSRMGFTPQFLSKTNHHGFPTQAIIVNFAIGMLTFLNLPGWQAMVNFLISLMVITYAIGPIALLCLRLNIPHHPRPFKLPCAWVFCTFSFYCCNLFIYWSGWNTISKLEVMLAIACAFFFFCYSKGRLTAIQSNEVKTGFWILPYLGGMGVLSYLSDFGGIGLIPFGWDFLVVALFSCVILYISLRNRSAVNATDIYNYLTKEAIPVDSH